MEKRLLKYDAFLEGAMVRAVCEANISFTDKFSETLAKIDSPVSISLAMLAGRDIDVNTNYLDVDIEKDGYATFVPDDKVEKLPYVVQHNPVFYTQTSILFGFKGADEDSALVQGQSVNLLKRYSREEIIDEFKKAYGEDKNSFVDTLYNAGKELCKVSFEAGGKYKEILCNSDSIKRNIGQIKPGSIKVGKLVAALFAKAGIGLKPTELEDFVNKYKSLVKQEREKFDSIKVVSGEEIRKLYNEAAYYSRSGTLGSSCMRYPRCSDYLDIYVDNEESVSLAVMMRDGLVTARALLWKDVDGMRMMDRIYTNDSSDVQLFINYASANGIWYKKQQNSYTGIPFIGPDGNERVIETAVQLKAGEYDRYPYMDTFKFYQVKTGLLFNHDAAAYDYELVDTNGGNGSCETCGGSGRIDCGECDGDGRHSCRQCDGDGQVDCSTCDGEGKEECDYCDEWGDMECSACDGSGKVEGGDGEEKDCSDCGGEGREKCGHCDGEGSRECGRCDGSGRRDCRRCDGGGDVDCEECGESGQVDCPECG